MKIKEIQECSLKVSTNTMEISHLITFIIIKTFERENGYRKSNVGMRNDLETVAGLAHIWMKNVVDQILIEVGQYFIMARQKFLHNRAKICYLLF